MGIVETLILYVLIGTAIAASLGARRGMLTARALPELAMWVLFWPFFAPAVLAQNPGSRATATGSSPTATAPSNRLHEAQERLLQAVHQVDGVAEGVLRPHLTQIDSMMRSLDHAQARLGEMEELLHSPEFDVAQVDGALQTLRSRGYDDEEARVRSLLSRRRNIERLRHMRDHTSDELERALLRLDEMSSQVKLLRFAEQPESRLASLLKDVAGNVEDLTKAVLEMNDLG